MRGRTCFQWEKAWFLTFSWSWYWKKFYVLEEISLKMALPETKGQSQEWSNMVMTFLRFKMIRMAENKKPVHAYCEESYKFHNKT